VIVTQVVFKYIRRDHPTGYYNKWPFTYIATTLGDPQVRGIILLHDKDFKDDKTKPKYAIDPKSDGLQCRYSSREPY
jgi:hypothetical protein